MPVKQIEKDGITTFKGKLKEMSPVSLQIRYEGKHDEAIENLKKILELNPQKNKIWEELANIYLMKLEPDNTITTCIDSLLINPTNEVSWLYLGLAFELKGEKKYKTRAWEHIDLPIHFNTYYDKNLAISTSHLGYAYFNSGQDEKAIKVYKDVVGLDPEYAHIWILFSRLYCRQQQYEKAIDACKKALRIDPEYDMAWNELGYIYGKIGQNENKAITAFNHVLNLDKDDYYAWNNLGWIYNKIGEYNKAIDACLQALKIRPESGVTMSHLGYAYYKTGDSLRAFELVQRSIELEPNYKLARQHLTEICETLGVDIEPIFQRIEQRIEQDAVSRKNNRLYHLYKLAKFLYSVKLVDKALITCNLCLEIDSTSKKLLKLKDKIQIFKSKKRI